MPVGLVWSDLAAIATFVVVSVGGVYAFGKWLRSVLRHEVHEITAPKFREIADQIKQDRGATEALRREVLGHMRTEEGRTEVSNQVVLDALEQLNLKLGQMQWRRGDIHEAES